MVLKVRKEEDARIYPTESDLINEHGINIFLENSSPSVFHPNGSTVHFPNALVVVYLCVRDEQKLALAKLFCECLFGEGSFLVE